MHLKNGALSLLEQPFITVTDKSQFFLILTKYHMHANSYYVYLYLRESDQTPYYVGKGTGNRMFRGSHSVNIPKDLNLIQVVQDELSDQDARILEMELIKKYGRKDNGTGILRNLTDGGEGRPGKLSTVGETRKKIKAEERLAMEKAKAKAKEDREERKAAKELAKEQVKADRARARNEKALRELAIKRAASKERAEARQQARDEEALSDLDEERKICPACKKRPVAINYHRNGKTYYKDRCDCCRRANKRPLPPSWVRSGYKKKEACEKCRFRFKHPEQAFVVHLDGNQDNADWANLKTICANCNIEITHSNLPWKPSKLTPDF